ncbi:MAG: nuclear transport factor 2 family protein [Ferruginibacter sp.]
MTVQEIAARFMELAKTNQYDQIQDELYSDDCESIEPPSAMAMGLPDVKGLEAIKEKGKKFNEMIEDFHSGYTGDLTVAGNFFSVPMGMDVTFKGAGRIKMDEIAVYEVKDGKICKEQFFF